MYTRTFDAVKLHVNCRTIYYYLEETIIILTNKIYRNNVN